MSKIGLLIIATNRYIEFLGPLLKSADKFFLKNHEVTYFVFTNQNIDIKTSRKISAIEIEHKPWPWMTLGRYKIFSDNSDILSEMDYLYYCDVDMLFVDDVGDEIIGDRVATHHCGFYLERGTPETNPESFAFVKQDEYMVYLAGGFNGGTSEEYLKMSNQLSKNIIKDYSNNIIAIWHDESHMNRYFIDNKPSIILDPGYCYHEGSNRPFKKRLLALIKNHADVRSEN